MNLVTKLNLAYEKMSMKALEKGIQFPTHPRKFIPKPIYNFMVKQLSKPYEDSDPILKQTIDWYVKNHIELEDLQSPLHMTPYLKFIRETKDIPGDILELGAYKCGTTITIAHYLKKINSSKTVYGCDTFQGFPYNDRFNESNIKNTEQCNDTSYEYVSDKIKRFNVFDNAIPIKGRFEDTLYQKLADKKFSFILLDCDIYDATVFCMPFIWERLVNGGICAFDEYDMKDSHNNSTWGEKKAVDDFCRTNNIEIQLTPVPHIIKQQNSREVK